MPNKHALRSSISNNRLKLKNSNGKSPAQQAQAQADLQRLEAQKAIEKAAARGYRLIPTVKDLMLDGKDLAGADAKIQITGLYRKIGDNQVLYASSMDAYQADNNYISDSNR